MLKDCVIMELFQSLHKGSERRRRRHDWCVRYYIQGSREYGTDALSVLTWQLLSGGQMWINCNEILAEIFLYVSCIAYQSRFSADKFSWRKWVLFLSDKY